MHEGANEKTHKAEHWRAFTVPISQIVADGTRRLDLKYWDPVVLNTINSLATEKFPALVELTTEKPRRGRVSSRGGLR